MGKILIAIGVVIALAVMFFVMYMIASFFELMSEDDESIRKEVEKNIMNQIHGNNNEIY